MPSSSHRLRQDGGKEEGKAKHPVAFSMTASHPASQLAQYHFRRVPTTSRRGLAQKPRGHHLTRNVGRVAREGEEERSSSRGRGWLPQTCAHTFPAAVLHGAIWGQLRIGEALECSLQPLAGGGGEGRRGRGSREGWEGIGTTPQLSAGVVRRWRVLGQELRRKLIVCRCLLCLAASTGLLYLQDYLVSRTRSSFLEGLHPCPIG